MQTGIYFFSDMLLRFPAYNLSKTTSFVAQHGASVARAPSGAQIPQKCRWQAQLETVTTVVRNRDNEKNVRIGIKNLQP